MNTKLDQRERDVAYQDSPENIHVEFPVRIVNEPCDSSGSSAQWSSEEEEIEEERLTRLSVRDHTLQEFWYIQKIFKFLKAGNQDATVVALSALNESDLTLKQNQRAIRDIGGIEVLVNLLETNDERCREGSLKLISTMSASNAICRQLVDLGIVSVLLRTIWEESLSVQILAAETLANLGKINTAERIVRAMDGIPKLVSLMHVPQHVLRTPRSKLTHMQRGLVDVAKAVAKALGSLARSSKNVEILKKTGSISVFASWIRSRHRDVIIFVMNTLQQGVSRPGFRSKVLREGLMSDFVRLLKDSNLELIRLSATVIFWCAEEPLGRQLLRMNGGLIGLVRLSDDPEMSVRKPLMAAVVGAIWKAAISKENACHLIELDVVPLLIKFLVNGYTEDNMEELMTNTVGALAELAKLPEVRNLIRGADGITLLVGLLNRVRHPTLYTNVAKTLGETARDKAGMDQIDDLDGVRLMWTLLQHDNKILRCTVLNALCPCIVNADEPGELVGSIVGGFEIIMNLLHSKDCEVLAHTCRLISEIAKDRENLAVLTDRGIVPLLSHLLVTKDDELRIALVEAIGNCCYWSKNAYKFGHLGVIDYMVRYLFTTKNKIILRNTINALHQLSANPFNCCAIHRSGVMPFLSFIMSSKDYTVQESAAGIINNIRQFSYAYDDFQHAEWLQNKRKKRPVNLEPRAHGEAVS